MYVRSMFSILDAYNAKQGSLTRHFKVRIHSIRNGLKINNSRPDCGQTISRRIIIAYFVFHSALVDEVDLTYNFISYGVYA